MVSLNEAVVVPLVAGQRDAAGVFAPNEVQAQAVQPMLDRLAEWCDRLRTCPD